ncbi:SubName: Full=Uncharacterized protein {ECO:0000313/EMBL:CCA72330.1} [Serendipita indica DSM 11827]|uniref:DUF6593 domain-containing protein n=1 Tax=Serendipita indica (strain DSM 11827) TaxID=1109443 RepID=G4TLY7_SERID|nr:SubName: Full=Uncharacterized protein {ECO:0000313/EMBL:CCA72330.1} [Serendipita indica DSM 11827]CCA72330.1 hypothetical protein PIIN_06264 [Serendipita indica DSM 11827]
MSIHLFMSNNSVYNTTLSCDSLGIHYDVTKSSDTGIITVTRWESSTNTNHFVAEFCYPLASPDKVRLGGQTEWMKRGEFLKRVEGHPLSLSRTFMGNNGTQYRWKIHWPKWVLCYASKDEVNQEPLVKYHYHPLRKNASYLEICDPAVMSSLDNISHS